MTEYDVTREGLVGSPGERVRFFRGGQPASYASVMQALSTSAAARSYLLDVLARTAFEAYFWEVVPVCRRSQDRPFEFVVLPAPSLVGVSPEPDAFGEQLRPDASVVSFKNLGRDAWLVAPCPLAAATAYPHLANFVRQAPEEQKQRLIECVARLVGESMGESPLWLSTSGLGVYWVHVRLDSRPKYYQFSEYRQHAPPG